MLHYETIEPATLELLRKIQSKQEFAELRLVGGTALALQLGHRKSVDLFYQSKYPNASKFMAVKSLLYFEDAEEDIMPIMLKKQSWSEVKKVVIEAVSNLS